MHQKETESIGGGGGEMNKAAQYGGQQRYKKIAKNFQKLNSIVKRKNKWHKFSLLLL
jgi:hypothetical protein